MTEEERNRLKQEQQSIRKMQRLETFKQTMKQEQENDPVFK